MKDSVPFLHSIIDNYNKHTISIGFLWSKFAWSIKFLNPSRLFSFMKNLKNLIVYNVNKFNY